MGAWWWIHQILSCNSPSKLTPLQFLPRRSYFCCITFQVSCFGPISDGVFSRQFPWRRRNQRGKCGRCRAEVSFSRTITPRYHRCAAVYTLLYGASVFRETCDDARLLCIQGYGTIGMERCWISKQVSAWKGNQQSVWIKRLILNHIFKIELCVEQIFIQCYRWSYRRYRLMLTDAITDANGSANWDNVYNINWI